MNIAILGYGKMGKAIETICASKEHSIGLKIDSKNTHLLNTKNLSNIDVAIEFSTPNTAFDNIAFCLNNNIPVISGTTGWLEELPKIKKLCKETQGSFLHSSNFSIGINIFIEILKKTNSLIKSLEYQINIIETHHTSKKDSPSGTALLLKELILNEQPRDIEIPIMSKRIGQNHGEHTITFSSNIDTIQLSHKANNRIGFAKGSILAAEFILNKTGFFSMKDVINTL